MRLTQVVRVTCLSLLAILISSCNEIPSSVGDHEDVARFFGNHKCGESPDYAIEMQSTVEPTQWDHVITVHGFTDDFDACEKLVDHLNRTATGNYRAVPLNR